MEDPISVRQLGQRPRRETDAIVERLRHRVEGDPADARARGALDAARWTLQASYDAPLTARRLADARGVEAETQLAQSVVFGCAPGDQARASGVLAWLTWWSTAQAPAPAWMVE